MSFSIFRENNPSWKQRTTSTPADFLKAIQLLFHDQYVKVTVEVEDSGETDPIRANTALHEKLVRRMKNVENGLVREVDSNKLMNDASADI